jgi:hypothetical protein
MEHKHRSGQDSTAKYTVAIMREDLKGGNQGFLLISEEHGFTRFQPQHHAEANLLQVSQVVMFYGLMH